MLRIFITIIIYVLGFAGLAQTTQNNDKSVEEKMTHQVDVVIEDISSDSGNVYFALYDSESNFNTRKPLKVAKSEIIDGVAKVSFKELEPNVYAITCYYDANNNGKMDFELNGMPLEDYGMTNNVMTYGPPQYSDGKFELRNKDLTFEIKL